MARTQTLQLVTPQGLCSVPLAAPHSWEGHGTAAKRTCLRIRVRKGKDMQELSQETRGPPLGTRHSSLPHSPGRQPLLDLQPVAQSKPGGATARFAPVQPLATLCVGGCSPAFPPVPTPETPPHEACRCEEQQGSSLQPRSHCHCH